MRPAMRECVSAAASVPHSTAAPSRPMLAASTSVEARRKAGRAERKMRSPRGSVTVEEEGCSLLLLLLLLALLALLLVELERAVLKGPRAALVLLAAAPLLPPLLLLLSCAA